MTRPQGAVVDSGVSRPNTYGQTIASTTGGNILQFPRARQSGNAVQIDPRYADNPNLPAVATARHLPASAPSYVGDGSGANFAFTKPLASPAAGVAKANTANPPVTAVRPKTEEELRAAYPWLYGKSNTPSVTQATQATANTLTQADRPLPAWVKGPAATAAPVASPAKMPRGPVFAKFREQRLAASNIDGTQAHRVMDAANEFVDYGLTTTGNAIKNVGTRAAGAFANRVRQSAFGQRYMEQPEEKPKRVAGVF